MNSSTNSSLGSALVSNTMVCETSKLFRAEPGTSDSPFQDFQGVNAKRLQDLFFLIDAIILYDNLYTLPARMRPDAERFYLRERLISEGVLEIIDTSSFHVDITRSIITGLEQFGNIQSDDSAQQDSELGNVDTAKRGFDEFFDITRNEAQELDPYRDTDRIDEAKDAYILSGGRSSGALYAETFQELAASLVWSMNYKYSGAYADCTSVLRDMYYICSAEVLAMPYWPQVDRLEFSKKFPNFIDKEFSGRLYKKFADGLRVSLAEIEEEFNEVVVFVPPFACVALDQSTNPDDLMERIFELRAEHATLRRNFHNLDRERHDAKTMKDRKKILLEQKRLLNAAGEAFDKPHIIKLESVIRYIPELTKPIVTPGDPTKYSANLLLQPIDWLLEWWRRRPISMLFDVAGHIREIEDYRSLASKIFRTAF